MLGLPTRGWYASQVIASHDLYGIAQGRVDTFQPILTGDSRCKSRCSYHGTKAIIRLDELISSSRYTIQAPPCIPLHDYSSLYDPQVMNYLRVLFILLSEAEEGFPGFFRIHRKPTLVSQIVVFQFVGSVDG
jgi:hypothetical protein